MRKTMIAVAAAVALGTATMATGAMARGGHGGGGGGHFAGHFGGGHFAGRGFGFRGRGFYGPGIGLYAYSPYYGGCYQRRLIQTPYGLIWRRVWICG